MPDDDPAVQSVVQQLPRICSRTRGRAIRADGIARWWLDEPDSPDPRIVDRALRALVRRGLVQPVSAPDGRVRYRSCVDGLERARGPSH